MQHLHSLDNLNLKDSWVTIGTYDGIHIGHQEIISSLVQQAHQNHALAVVITFFPHPAMVLRDISEPYYLTTPDEQAEILNDFGVDYLISIPFTKEFAKITASEFIHKIKSELDLKSLWVGEDFKLGKNREGNLKFLQKMGKSLDYELNIITTVKFKNNKISSSSIRQMVKNGNMDEATGLLGRPFSVSGIVVTGDNRGHTLGFPTANLEFPILRLLPKPGVYATCTHYKSIEYPSVTNVGFNPTFGKNLVLPRIETYILDFSRQIYGEFLKIDFIQYLRPELKFNSVEDLIKQIDKDILQTREVYFDVK